MKLCDIGNSYFHFYHAGRIWKEEIAKLASKDSNEPLYYISVNPKGEKKLIQTFGSAAVDITRYFEIDSIYRGLGIDRIAACNAVTDGVIIDAGSAITVDIMQSGVHLGGYILPGISGYLKCYRRISNVLGQGGFNLGIDLGAFPQNTQDAISYGVLKSILLTINHSSKNKKIYFTGGDGKFLARFFENSVVDNSLVFKGMMNVVNSMQQKEKPIMQESSSLC